MGTFQVQIYSMSQNNCTDLLHTLFLIKKTQPYHSFSVGNLSPFSFTYFFLLSVFFGAQHWVTLSHTLPSLTLVRSK